MHTYERAIVAWANEQARLLRAGRFDLLDITHIAEEIEDVGKSEPRELANRMAVLLTPSLQGSLVDPDWWEDTWLDARTGATNENGIGYDVFPSSCPWTASDELDQYLAPLIPPCEDRAWRLSD